MEYVVGPLIQAAEKLFARRVKNQHTLLVAEQMVDVMLGSNWIPAKAEGWTKEIAVVNGKKYPYDVMWIRGDSDRMIPILADYARLLQHLIEFDSVKVLAQSESPVGFFIAATWRRFVRRCATSLKGKPDGSR